MDFSDKIHDHARVRPSLCHRGFCRNPTLFETRDGREAKARQKGFTFLPPIRRVIVDLPIRYPRPE